MKAIEFVIVASLFFSFAKVQAAVACLDQMPQTHIELEQKIFRAATKLNILSQAELNAKELAQDAQRTHTLSTSVFSASLALLTFSGLGLRVGYGMMTDEMGAELGLMVFLASIGADLGIAGEYLANFISRYNNISKKSATDYVNNLLAKADSLQCSYAKSAQFVQEQRNKIFDGRLDGSAFNSTLDHVTLGSVSEKATANLYYLAYADRLLAERELQDLKALRSFAAVKN